MFVIINKGRYVKDMHYGGDSSYTTNIEYAQKFPTAELARASARDDEIVQRLP